MPAKKIVLSAKVETQSELTDKLAGLHMTDKITKSQAASALQFLLHYVPCQLRIDMRTDKGRMYVQAQGAEVTAFTVGPRAKVSLVLDNLAD